MPGYQNAGKTVKPSGKARNGMFRLTGAEALRDAEGHATMPAVMGGSGDPIEELEQKVETGEVSADDVERRKAYWNDHLRNGVRLPNGEQATITWRGLHHILDDPKFLADPARIDQVLRNVDEIRTLAGDRRVALSHWHDLSGEHWGFAILSPAGYVIAVHSTRERALRRYRRQGSQLWKQ